MSKKDDNLKNGAVETPETKEVMVEMTQEKLDKLIGKGYGKGANKAKDALVTELGVESIEQLKEMIKAKAETDEASKTDLEKSATTIATLEATIKRSESANKTLAAEMIVERLASENDVSDVDYFKHLLAEASKAETFESDTFIKQLKTTKPYLFDKTKIKIDNSPNKTPTALNEKIKGAKTMDELRALQGEVDK